MNALQSVSWYHGNILFWTQIKSNFVNWQQAVSFPWKKRSLSNLDRNNNCSNILCNCHSVHYLSQYSQYTYIAPYLIGFYGSGYHDMQPYGATSILWRLSELNRTNNFWEMLLFLELLKNVTVFQHSLKLLRLCSYNFARMHWCQWNKLFLPRSR